MKLLDTSNPYDFIVYLCCMKIQVLKNTDFTESNWSGGSTKQLYIFPEDASYADRNFQIRISTAKVEVPESTFTSLPGYSRKLIILEGEITITHQNHHSKELKPFEVDSFLGDWETAAIGTCVDFNVMTNASLESELECLNLSERKSIKITDDSKWEMYCIYPLNGDVEVYASEKSTLVETGNLFVASELMDETLLLRGLNATKIVIVKIARI